MYVSRKVAVLKVYEGFFFKFINLSGAISWMLDAASSDPIRPAPADKSDQKSHLHSQPADVVDLSHLQADVPDRTLSSLQDAGEAKKNKSN